jgi:hypothetical protein
VFHQEEVMNEKMLALLHGDASKYPHKLEESFPHVFNRILDVWGTAAAGAFFDELMLSSRPGRAGFPPDATAEIWALHRIYASQAPVKEIDDIWSTGTDDAHHSRLAAKPEDKK